MRATTSGVPPLRAIRLDRRLQVGRDGLAVLLDQVIHRVRRAFADGGAVEVHAGHARLGGEGDEVHPLRGCFARAHGLAAQAVLFLGQHDDGAAFGGLVGQGSQLGGFGQLLGWNTPDRDEFHRLAVAQGDRAGLVQQQHVHIPGGFHRPARHGDHVALDQAVHAGDADGGEQPADGGGDQADQQGHQHGDGDGRALPGRLHAVEREGQQGGADDQEDDGETGQQDIQGNLVGGLLAFGAFHQADHAVQETLAGIGGDAHDQPVGEQARPAGDGAAVAARFADDRGAFAGDGALVHRGDAFDDLAVRGEDVAGFHQEQVVLAQSGRGDQFVFGLAVRAGQFLGLGGLAGPAQRLGLGLAAPFGQGFGEVGEQDGEPQPEGDRADETGRGFALAEERLDPQDGGQQAAHLHHEHDRVAHHPARVELDERIQDRALVQLAPNRWIVF